jgi:hypothetical protein
MLGEGAGMAPAPEDFSRKEDALEKPLSPSVEKLRDASNLRQVEAEEDPAHRPKKRAIRSESGTG